MILLSHLSKLMSTIFDENATAQDLLLLVVFIAIFWALAFALVSMAIRPLVYGKPWLVAAGERDYDHGGKELYETFGIAIDKDNFIRQFMDRWPWNCGVVVQHVIGGALCLPSLLGIGDPAIASSLACLGILSEMGWEIEDIISWIIKRFFRADGKATIPNALILVLATHHSLTTCLGLPIILNYRSLRTLHWVCFNLQMAGATALGVTEYTKMLDITKPKELGQFKVLTFLVLVIMVWTRAIHWTYLCADFIQVWYQDKAWGFLAVGSVMITIFSIFNWLLCIQPMYRRFAKFMRASADYSSLPDDASVQSRRSSVVALEVAAANVLGHHQLDEELAALFVNRNVPSRRSTMPASFRSNARRSSWTLLRSSAGDVSRVLSHLNFDEDTIKND